MQSNTLFGGFSVNGSRERSNNFLMDGTDNNDPDFGGFPRGLSASESGDDAGIPRHHNSYLPEFGRNSGAIIDIVTKHGTNDFHADAYWFGRYTALSAKDYFAADRDDDPFVRNQFGYSLGGPIQKNRTFFFVNERVAAIQHHDSEFQHRPDGGDFKNREVHLYPERTSDTD